MGLTYTDVLSLHFGNSEFTTNDVRILLRNERSAKLLSDLKFKGTIERTGRGKYRILLPSERLDNRTYEWKRVERIVNMSPFPFAWAWSSAVERWTDGRYIVGPNPYFRIFYIEIIKTDLDGWRSYLKGHSVSVEAKKRVGATVELIPRTELEYVFLNGEKIVPKGKILETIKDHPGIFAKADDLIEY